MNCPLCGEICRCHSELPPPATPRTRPDAQSTAWRDEISARLSRYRARRRIRPPRYPSLRLQFDEAEPSGTAVSPAFDLVSDQALALNGMRQRPAATDDDALTEHSSTSDAQVVSSPSGPSGARILEFPKFTWALPPPPLDQLAEPVVTRPRILEVPEVAPEPPALGGITMEAASREESGKQPRIDVPLEAGSLARRVLASTIDGSIVAVASALFGFIFWKVSAARPPLLQMLSLAVGIPCLIWAAYQYLLIIYAASTPGWRLAGLKLTRFDGAGTSRSLRRWRVLASYLSGAALGMGFAWAFLDEDALCWHDRITRTYLTRKEAR